MFRGVLFDLCRCGEDEGDVDKSCIMQEPLYVSRAGCSLVAERLQERWKAEWNWSESVMDRDAFCTVTARMSVSAQQRSTSILRNIVGFRRSFVLPILGHQPHCRAGPSFLGGHTHLHLLRARSRLSTALWQVSQNGGCMKTILTLRAFNQTF